MSFRIGTEPLDGAALRAGLLRHDAGACVVFEGWVRDVNEGRSVTRLEYYLEATAHGASQRSAFDVIT